jgi:hypothetical protein
VITYVNTTGNSEATTTHGEEESGHIRSSHHHHRDHGDVVGQFPDAYQPEGQSALGRVVRDYQHRSGNGDHFGRHRFIRRIGDRHDRLFAADIAGARGDAPLLAVPLVC